MELFKKTFLVLASLLIFLYVIFFIEPPKSWQLASYFQILVFFIPILMFFTFLADILIDYLPKSFLIGLLLMLFGVFYSSGILNIFTGIVLFVFLIMSLKYFPDKGLHFFGRSLTRFTKMPKLSRFRRKR